MITGRPMNVPEYIFASAPCFISTMQLDSGVDGDAMAAALVEGDAMAAALVEGDAMAAALMEGDAMAAALQQDKAY